MPGGTAPEVPGGTAPEVPGGTAPEVPGGTAPEVPGGTAPEVPGGTAPEVPGGTAPEVPGGTALTVWLTGLPGAGKSTIAEALCARLRGSGVPVAHLDGDELRRGLNAGLGFSRLDRAEAVRRAGNAALAAALAGSVVVVSMVSPYADDRAQVRSVHGDAGVAFAEVWVSAPLEVCRARDPKGLYARALTGELKGMTGVDDPYEDPSAPEMIVATDRVNVADAVAMVVGLVESRTVKGSALESRYQAGPGASTSVRRAAGQVGAAD